MTLSGQIALVTGASRGIGRAAALSLGQAGAYVIVNYRGNQAAAEQSLAAIVEAGGKGELSQFDIAAEDQVEAAMKKIVDGQGKIDILVNNAGVTADSLLIRMKPADWKFGATPPAKVVPDATFPDMASFAAAAARPTTTG